MDEKLSKTLEEYRQIISRILGVFKNVPFPIILEAATNTKVEPFYLDQEKDRKLVNELSKIANIVMNRHYKMAIDKNRINEVSNFLEKQISPLFIQHIANFNVIRSIDYVGGVGYPDVKVLDIFNEVTYVDIKATMRPETGSARDFYFTPLEQTKRKVVKSGHHTILGFIIEGKPNSFKTAGWKLVDLSKIRVSMKPEFNADNTEIYRENTILAENYA